MKLCFRMANPGQSLPIVVQSSETKSRILTPILTVTKALPNVVTLPAPPLLAFKPSLPAIQPKTPPLVSISTPSATPTITKISNIKVVKKMNVPFANMEMSQELLLKSRLINEFSMQGVTFTQEMLTIISNYWQESKKVYSEKCKVLENDLSKLRHKCDAQEAKIKELECLLSESQEKIKENDENQCLHSNMDEVFKIIRYLNTKFLADVEINLRDSQKTLCKPSWKIPEEKPVVEEKIPEDLGSLASKLYELIQISSNDDLKLYHAQSLITS